MQQNSHWFKLEVLKLELEVLKDFESFSKLPSHFSESTLFSMPNSAITFYLHCYSVTHRSRFFTQYFAKLSKYLCRFCYHVPWATWIPTSIKNEFPDFEHQSTQITHPRLLSLRVYCLQPELLYHSRFNKIRGCG